MSTSGALRPRAGIAWATDARRVVVASADGRRAQVLEDADATIWSWLQVSLSEQRLVAMVGALLGLEPTEATEHVRARLHAWDDAGLLETVPEGDLRLDGEVR